MINWSPIGETVLEARVPLRFHGQDAGDVCVCLVEGGQLYLAVPGHGMSQVRGDLAGLRVEGERVEVSPSLWFKRKGGRLVVSPCNVPIGSVGLNAFEMAMRFVECHSTVRIAESMKE